MSTRPLNAHQINETQTAERLHTALAGIDITTISVRSVDRHLPRKQQAKLARELFRDLGLKGISVRTPNYSMASTVEVGLPRRCDHDLEGGFMVPGCAAATANSTATTRIHAILLAAFPRHDDRSDTMTDYYDRCWSVL